jgi:hypothetical protein
MKFYLLLSKLEEIQLAQLWWKFSWELPIFHLVSQNKNKLRRKRRELKMRLCWKKLMFCHSKFVRNERQAKCWNWTIIRIVSKYFWNCSKRCQKLNQKKFLKILKIYSKNIQNCSKSIQNCSKIIQNKKIKIY